MTSRGSKRGAQVAGDDAEEFLGVVLGRLGEGRIGVRLAVAQAGDDAAGLTQGVGLVDGEVVGEAGGAGVHLGAAQGLVVALLAGGHLDQGRPAEEHLRALLDHDHVVGHAGDVGAPRGRVAEDDGDGGDPGRRQPCEVPEDRAAGDEDLLLGGQVGAAGLDEADAGQPVGEGDVVGAQGLLQRPGVAGAAAHGGVVGGDQALDALDDADAGDERGADRVLAPPGRQRRQLQEGRVRVEEQLDALAGEELAALAVPGDVLLAAALEGLGVFGVQVGELGEHGLAVRAVVGVGGVQGGGEDGHSAFAGAYGGTVTAEPPGCPGAGRAAIHRAPWPAGRNGPARRRPRRGCPRRRSSGRAGGGAGAG
ncbi:hypothetical protein STENM327S_02821 [Streptomyces tendae]